jgi:hypothetical protein
LRDRTLQLKLAVSLFEQPFNVIEKASNLLQRPREQDLVLGIIVIHVGRHCLPFL